MRAVLVIGGLAGDGEKMQELRRELLQVHQATGIRLEVLHLPMGISRWRVVTRRFSLAVNDLGEGRALDRHEAVLEVPGAPQTYVGDRRYQGIQWPALDGDEGKMKELFKRFPSWNYTVPSN